MNPKLRKWLSLQLAKIRNVLTGEGGFFIQYEHAASVKPVVEPYPEIASLCEAAPYRAIVAEMAGQIAALERFDERSSGPVLGRGMLSPLDGASIYTVVRMSQPKRIIEIGSGDSTFFLAAAADQADIICIDPAPRQAIDHLANVEVRRRLLSEEDIACCAALDANDILFFDGSHIMLPGTDVDITFNRIFPRLRPGVLVHVHDIFLPYDYPPHWRDRNWSEQNALVGWLFGAFEIVYPGHYVAREHASLIDDAFRRLPMPKNAGSMWLRKI